MKSCLPGDAGSADSPDRDPALLAAPLLHKLLRAADDPAPFWLDNNSFLCTVNNYSFLHTDGISSKCQDIQTYEEEKDTTLAESYGIISNNFFYNGVECSRLLK